MPDWRGRPWHETVLYELHAGTLGGFAGVQADAAAPGRARRHRDRADADRRFPGARNWGYDGVLPFAPDRAYGTPDELKALVDAAHGLGLMVFLDVVYNHFGPDGNYLARLRAGTSSATTSHTPWGAAIDFRRPRGAPLLHRERAVLADEYRFDGLRFDAVHAIADADWLDEMAAEVRAPSSRAAMSIWCWRTTATSPTTCAAASTRSGTTTAITSCTCC